MGDFRANAYAFLPLIVLLWGCAFTVQSTYAKEILVGGKEGWHFAFNYTAWASEAGPFHVNDSLVFKYHPPTANSFTHNVYLLKNKLHYKACLIVGGRLLANATQGTGDGFCYKLTSPKHYYFACGIGNGTHCEQGFMNFGVKALLH